MIPKIPEIAKLPDQRKLWFLRKLYGNLPPTDPRFLALTSEQIELDLEHWKIDNADKLKGREIFTDDDYEQYEKDIEKFDEKTTDGMTLEDYFKTDKSIVLSTSEVDLSEDNWEDVEIDDQLTSTQK